MSDLNNDLKENFKVEKHNQIFQIQNNNYGNINNFNAQQCPSYINNNVQTFTNNENINNTDNQKCPPHINNIDQPVINNENTNILINPNMIDQNNDIPNIELTKYEISITSKNDQINQNEQNNQNNQNNQNMNFPNYNNNQHNQGLIVPFTTNSYEYIQNMNNIRYHNNLRYYNNPQISNQTRNQSKKFTCNLSSLGSICCYICIVLLFAGIFFICCYIFVLVLFVVLYEPTD